MKTFIAASLLLAMTLPGHASEFRKSDRKWLPTVNQWADMYWPCMKGQGDEDNEAYETFRAEACKTMHIDQNRLIAAGYCVYANGGIGRPSKNRKHCYTIDWPADLGVSNFGDPYACAMHCRHCFSRFNQRFCRRCYATTATASAYPCSSAADTAAA